jgi:hypothetical protein
VTRNHSINDKNASVEIRARGVIQVCTGLARLIQKGMMTPRRSPRVWRALTTMHKRGQSAYLRICVRLWSTLIKAGASGHFFFFLFLFFLFSAFFSFFGVSSSEVVEAFAAACSLAVRSPPASSLPAIFDARELVSFFGIEITSGWNAHSRIKRLIPQMTVDSLRCLLFVPALHGLFLKSSATRRP